MKLIKMKLKDKFMSAMVIYHQTLMKTLCNQTSFKFFKIRALYFSDKIRCHLEFLRAWVIMVCSSPLYLKSLT